MKYSIIVTCIILIMYGCKDGRDDIRRSYHPNGKLKSIGKYLNDSIPIDTIKHYDSDGAINSVLIFDSTGLQAGTSIFYYKSGRVRQTQPYLAGKLNGIVQEYSSNGILISSVNFRRGKKVGESKFYNDSTGTLELYNFYDFNSNNLLVREFSNENLIETLGDVFLVDSVLNLNDTLLSTDFLEVEILIAHPPKSNIQVDVFRVDCNKKIIDTIDVNGVVSFQQVKIPIDANICEVWINGIQYDSINRKNDYLRIKHLLK